jgi:hypothetical protein
MTSPKPRKAGLIDGEPPGAGLPKKMENCSRWSVRHNVRLEDILIVRIFQGAE